MNRLHNYFAGILAQQVGLTNTYNLNIFDIMVIMALILVLTLVVYNITNFIILNGLKHYLARTKILFLNVIIKNKTFNLLAPLFSSFIFWSLLKLLKQYCANHVLIINSFYYFGLSVLLFLVLFVISKFLWSFNDYYEARFEFSEHYPIDSYVRVGVLFFWVIGLLIIVATLANTSLITIFTGIGAISAVFLLIFRDALLGIMSSIQVTASNIIRVGDWISINRLGVSGTIIDISVMTVRVKSFDNTISTVPTYSFISEVVQNYRGMIESGGRRIMRSIKIDINTIKECSDELIMNLKQFKFVDDYINDKRKLKYTNLELFRSYILGYLKSHPDINQDFVSVVHHLEPGQYGLPLQLYAFCRQTSFDKYEEVQADIFEHCFAVMPSFELKIMQYPNG